MENEWLVTNGLGGYASGMIQGDHTRSYHAFLVAALPAPLGRIVIWSHLFERLAFADGEWAPLPSSEFRLQNGLPIWCFNIRGSLIERRIFLPYLQNTAIVTYTLLGGSDLVKLELEPAFDFRKHGSSVGSKSAYRYTANAVDGGQEIAALGTDLPPCRLSTSGGEFRFVRRARIVEGVTYPEEAERGYSHLSELWSPGVFRVHLHHAEPVALIGSTEPWRLSREARTGPLCTSGKIDRSDGAPSPLIDEAANYPSKRRQSGVATTASQESQLWAKISRVSPSAALLAEQKRRSDLLVEAGRAGKDTFGARLVLAADQFVIRPVGRAEHDPASDVHEISSRTIIAGYHWFTDWGRDTMISLEGLTITTRRFLEARKILLTFASYVRDGLIPNLFPDGESKGLYHTADATLWFFHAVGRYLRQTNDAGTRDLLLPTLVTIAEAHLRGTKFNIHVDPADGLLVQGEKGYQLTWMDAKMDEWVVTPRRGKAVEINALWYNALKLLEGWLREVGDASAAERYATHARRAFQSFNRRFWFERGGYLYDVIDSLDGGAYDSACRPNQIFAVSLDHAVLEEELWPAVLDIVQRELLTPVGLRSLSPKHPEYKPIYHGDLRTRDAAYHQGTVWAWLIGPFIDAWLKVHPGEVARARGFLAHFPAQLDEAGVGTISEVFDAQEPHFPRGCIAQAWSVAEVLRCWVKTRGARWISGR